MLNAALHAFCAADNAINAQGKLKLQLQDIEWVCFQEANQGLLAHERDLTRTPSLDIEVYMVRVTTHMAMVAYGVSKRYSGDALHHLSDMADHELQMCADLTDVIAYHCDALRQVRQNHALFPFNFDYKPGENGGWLLDIYVSQNSISSPMCDIWLICLSSEKNLERKDCNAAI